jgi:hypothetical protein
MSRRTIPKKPRNWGFSQGKASEYMSVFWLPSVVASSLCLSLFQGGDAPTQLLDTGKALLGQLPPVTKTASGQAYLVNRLENLEQSGLAQASGRSPITSDTPTEPRATSPTPALRQGTRISLNGRTLTAAWKQWQPPGAASRTGISDAGLVQALGMELLSNQELSRQPVHWFSDPTSTPLILATDNGGAYRYLDITDFAKKAGLQLQVSGDTLQISSTPARVANIRKGKQAWGERIVVDLDRPTPWQVSGDLRTTALITLDAASDPLLIQRFTPPPPNPLQGILDKLPLPLPDDDSERQADQSPLVVESTQNQTTIRVPIPEGMQLQVSSLPNPHRLVIDLRPDAMPEREILWAPGLRWRQQYVTLGTERFPVVWLEANPRSANMQFRPIWGNPQSMVGTAPLIQTAPLWQSAAAINVGFFNRNNQLPLGAIRRDGRWLSGPILERAAIAWNERGQFKIGRLSLQEVLVTATGEQLPVLFLNSGYVKAGISRYTREWGSTYTPLVDNEILLVVQNDRITEHLVAGTAGEGAFAIPTNGYLLALRSSPMVVASLAVGTPVRLMSATAPTEFGAYPHILGAGPLLVQNRQIVLDATAEQFSEAFAGQFASRSAIATTASGTVLIAAIHNRVGGRGPNLQETAQLMQQLGAVDALNLDGGSSTSLYLGGQLLDRAPSTAARVHNGLGIFLQPR